MKRPLKAHSPRPFASAWAILSVAAALGCQPSGSWNETFHRSEGWWAADGGSSTQLPDGRTVWLFGDSFIRNPNGYVDNSFAVQDSEPGRAPAKDEIRFFARNPDGEMLDISRSATAGMRPWVEPAPGGGANTWLWPVDALSTSGRFVSIFSEMGCARGEFPACRSYIGNMGIVGHSVVEVDNPSSDPEKWRLRTTRLTDRRGQPPSAQRLHWGVTLLEDAGWLYVFGTSLGAGLAVEDLKVARVVLRDLHRYDRWQFLTPQGWQMIPTGPAPVELQTLARGVAGELSVDRVSRAGQTWFVLVHTDTLTKELVVRSAAASDVESIRWSGPEAGRGVRRLSIPAIDPVPADPTRENRVWAGRAHLHQSSSSEHLLMGYFSLQALSLRFVEVPLAEVVDGW